MGSGEEEPAAILMGDEVLQGREEQMFYRFCLNKNIPSSDGLLRGVLLLLLHRLLKKMAFSRDGAWGNVFTLDQNWIIFS